MLTNGKLSYIGSTDLMRKKYGEGIILKIKTLDLNVEKELLGKIIGFALHIIKREEKLSEIVQSLSILEQQGRISEFSISTCTPSKFYSQMSEMQS